MLDASSTLPWCFPDEATPWTETLLDRLAGGEPALVPAHWPTEVMNGLVMAMRRGRVSLDKVQEFVEVLSDLPLQIETAHPPQTWPPILALAQRHRLSAYDAAYLELARRENLPLATLDGDLQVAARADGVSLLEISR